MNIKHDSNKTLQFLTDRSEIVARLLTRKHMWDSLALKLRRPCSAKVRRLRCLDRESMGKMVAMVPLHWMRPLTTLGKDVLILACYYQPYELMYVSVNYQGR